MTKTRQEAHVEFGHKVAMVGNSKPFPLEMRAKRELKAEL
jgi:hypothetical protein